MNVSIAVCCMIQPDLGSGWITQRIKGVTIHTVTFNPVGGSSNIPTPTRLALRKVIVNVQNHNEFCFLYSILAQIHPASDNSHRKSKYAPFIKEFNTKGLTFPF